MSSKELARRLARVQERLHLRPRDTRLPYLVIDPETGASWPGYEDHNEEHERLARRFLVSAKCYGFDPNQDGSEP
jgi:hypothetical protein